MRTRSPSSASQRPRLSEAGDRAGALAGYREALALFAALSGQTTPEYRSSEAIALGKLAKLLGQSAAGGAEARELLLRGIAILETLERDGKIDSFGKDALPDLRRELLAVDGATGSSR